MLREATATVQILHADQFVAADDAFQAHGNAIAGSRATKAEIAFRQARLTRMVNNSCLSVSACRAACQPPAWSPLRRATFLSRFFRGSVADNLPLLFTGARQENGSRPGTTLDAPVPPSKQLLHMVQGRSGSKFLFARHPTPPTSFPGSDGFAIQVRALVIHIQRLRL